eukprot:SAG31_NODE_2083_length_6490_cov_21.969645_4_plen_110_part_00
MPTRPAFGGSSGLLFWITYCINVTFNVVSFTEVFLPTYMPNYQEHLSKYWAESICSSVTLFLLFIIAYMGAGEFAKVRPAHSCPANVVEALRSRLIHVPLRSTYCYSLA